MRPQIAFQGEPGAFSHLACRTWYPGHEPTPCATFGQAFDALTLGRCDLALLPVENTIAGAVEEVAELLRQRPLRCIGEHLLPVRMQMMAVRGVVLADVRRVSSHIMALRQCEAIIRALGLQPEPAPDTAGAARALALSGDRAAAVFASDLAAQLYGLDVLQRDVHDVADNATRFLALRLRDTVGRGDLAVQNP